MDYGHSYSMGLALIREKFSEFKEIELNNELGVIKLMETIGFKSF